MSTHNIQTQYWYTDTSRGGLFRVFEYRDAS